MCISYITIKSSLSGNEMGHMCEWGVFQMTAEQFRDIRVLDLVPDFEGAWRPFCTYAPVFLFLLLLLLLSLLLLLHSDLLPSLSNICSLHLLSYRPHIAYLPFTLPFHIYIPLFFSPLYLISFCFSPSHLIPSQRRLPLSQPANTFLQGLEGPLVFNVCCLLPGYSSYK